MNICLSRRKIGSIIFCITLSGCQINPTPINFSKGKKTPDFTIEIFNQIQCEIRDALVAQAAGLILESEKKKNLQYPGAAQIGEDLKTEPSNVKTFESWQIDPRAYVQAWLFLKSQIGLTFDLTTSETNNASINPTFNPSGGTHSVSLGITNHSLGLTRKNQRLFTTIETDFDSYINKNCHYDPKNGQSTNLPIRNWIYPIHGRIELNKTFDTFVRYALNDIQDKDRYKWASDAIETVLPSATNNQLQTLSEFVEYGKNIKTKCQNSVSDQCEAAKKCYDKTVARAGNEYVRLFNENKKTSDIQFTDTLKFTTSLNGGLEPSLTLSPGSGSFKLNMLTSAFSSGRESIHMLTIALAADTYDEPKKATRTIEVGGTKEAKLIVKIPGETKSVEAIKECLPVKEQSNAKNIVPRLEGSTSDPSSEAKNNRENEAIKKQLDEAIKRNFENEFIRERR